jgi:hypothetical protein
MNWIKYSGASISITVNPLHWRLLPNAGREFAGEWAGPNQHNWYAAWLFLTLRVWIDDGSW